MITDLRLINIRNYADTTFQFGPLTVIVGPNGQGKTNIIESLFFLSTGRSFRTAHDKEMIRFGQPFGRMQSGPIDITLVSGPILQKQVRIHQKPARLLNILGVTPSVLFTPMSVALIDGSPVVRRQFIDILLSQTDPIYARNLLEYQRALKQRNQLLHQIVHQGESAESLSLWDDLLVSTAIPVVMTRKTMVEQMKSSLGGFYTQVSAKKHDKLEVEYVASVEKHGEPVESELDLATRFHERLRERRPAELKMARTVVGPHRDDMIFYLNQKPVAMYGSRGEMRTVVVALKLFEFHYMKEQSPRHSSNYQGEGGKEPTLLFDDVFSEFDATRRKTVLDIAPEAQVIFTVTDMEYAGKLPSHAQVINLTENSKQ